MCGGFLAIWSDVAPEQETDYLHWLMREHTSERLGVEGFRRVRVYRSLQSTIRRYFIWYELESAAVLGSKAYLARLNDPTPWSRRIMPILRNFARGGGRVLAQAGTGHGAVLAAIKLGSPAPITGDILVDNIARDDRVATATLLETDQEQTSIQTHEKSMRERDRGFAGLLLVDGLDEHAVATAVIKVGYPSRENLYTQVFQL